MTDQSPQNSLGSPDRVLFIVNEAFFFVSHRLPLARRLMKAGFEVHVAAPPTHDWAPEEFSVDELSENGCVFHPIRLSRRGENPISEILTTVDIFRLILSIKPTILHLLTIKPILYGGVVARLLRVRRVICGFTGLGQVFGDETWWGRVRHRIVSQILRHLLRNPRAVAVVQNLEDQEIIASLAPPGSNKTMTIFGSGVDLEEFAFRASPAGRPLILFAARLLWEKGVGVFVDAARILRDRGLDARFVIVGTTVETNPNSVPRTLLEQWVSEGVIEWWDYRRDMPDVIAGCSVFCLPTVYREGVPKVLLEAAATGRPIVTTNIGGCREVVTDGRNGFLCAPFDVESVSARLETLINDRQLRDDMGRESRIIAEERFGVEAIVIQTLAMYGLFPPAGERVNASPGDLHGGQSPD